MVHITDLYHPPQDPDDHVDLATILALPEFDLRAVILDSTRQYLEGADLPDHRQRDPGFVPVRQLAWLTGRIIPAAAGPTAPLHSPDDPATDRPPWEQTGIELLLHTLSEAASPVIVSVVGSARVLAAAFNREPDLVRKRVSSVLLNAGASGQYREWNVALDPAAYRRVFEMGVGVDWYPCATEQGPFDPGAHNTFWKANQRDLFMDIHPALRSWFMYAYTGSPRADTIRALGEPCDMSVWERILSDNRNMWSTASFILAAGRRLVRTGAGWRFVPADRTGDGGESEILQLDPVETSWREDDHVQWAPAVGPATVRLFRREPAARHTDAMTEALNALLAEMEIRAVDTATA